MKAKKFLTSLLILGLVLSSSVTAFGAPQPKVASTVFVTSGVQENKLIREPKISEEEAIRLAKEYAKEFLNTAVDEQDFQMNIHNMDDRGLYIGKNVWYINFYKYKRDTSLSVDVSINGDSGKLISINKWDHSILGENQVSRFTREEARKVAYEFLKNNHSDLLDQLELNETYYPIYTQEQGLRPTNYSFNFVRQKHGIPVLNDGVNIGVNSGSGEVTSYSFTWNDEDLPEKENIISKEKAQKLIEEGLAVNLNYIPVRDISDPYNSEIKEVRMAYSQEFKHGTQIDAKTGEFINYPNTSSDEIRKRDLTDVEKLEINRLAENIPEAKEITNKESAKKIAEEILSGIYDEETKIKNINYSSNIRMNNKSYKSWEIQFGFGDTGSEGYISLDAATGNITNLNYYNWQLRDSIMSDQKEFERKITWEESYEKAIEILKKLYPDKLKSTKTEQIYRQNYHYYNDKKIEDVEYYFNFSREENGVIFSNNYLTVSIDAVTGRVQSIYMNWDDVTLPKIEDIIDKETAKEVFIKGLDIKLVYSYIYPNGIANEESPEIKLVYTNMLTGDNAYFNLLDAKTGKFLDWSGKEKTSLDSKKDLIEQLNTHWAYKELKIMAERNIIDLEKASVDDKVTKKQFIKMMTLAKGSIYYGGTELQELKFTDIDKNDLDYRYIQLAVEYGLINNDQIPLQADQYITREEVAEILIRAANLDKIASIEGIYNIPVSDAESISKDRLGHVALAYGLGIVNGRGENYAPKEEVDLAQVAVSIYRIMESMGNSFVRY